MKRLAIVVAVVCGLATTAQAQAPDSLMEQLKAKARAKPEAQPQEQEQPEAEGAESKRLTFDEVRGFDDERLARVQVRLTYLGPAHRSFPSVAFTLPEQTADPQLAASFAREGLDYGTYQTRLVVCPITPAELRAGLEALATRPDVTDGGVDSLALFSFAIVDTAGGAPRAFESVLNDATALDLATHLGEALKSNVKASGVLGFIGCGLDLTPPDPEGEVTESVAVILGSITRDDPRRVTCTVSVVNTSREPLPGPLVVVITADPPRVQLAEGDGMTCRVFYPGCPYLLFPLEKPLGRRERVERRVVFENPRRESFKITHRAFVGVEPR